MTHRTQHQWQVQHKGPLGITCWTREQILAFQSRKRPTRTRNHPTWGKFTWLGWDSNLGRLQCDYYDVTSLPWHTASKCNHKHLLRNTTSLQWRSQNEKLSLFSPVFITPCLRQDLLLKNHRSLHLTPSLKAENHRSLHRAIGLKEGSHRSPYLTPNLQEPHPTSLHLI